MGMDGKQIFEIINDISADQKHKDEISVLPIMCGSGKSTAISYKIRQTIEQADETGDGLLVVTDRIDRMHDYLSKSKDTELLAFLKKNKHRVTIMERQTIEDAYKIQKYTPVLMMTSQRFFQLSVEEINSFLRWEKGSRPLILIDERPELKTIVELDNKKLSDCEEALKSSFQKLYSPSLEIRRAIEEFEKFTYHMHEKPCRDHDNLYCFWSWCDKNQLDNYQQAFDESFENITKKKSTVNQFGGGEYYEDIYTRIKAVRTMETGKALFCQRKNLKSGLFRDELNIMLDNYSLVHDAEAKVIILDGTADLTPDYKIDYYNIYDTPDTKRPLNKLIIKLINIPTAKTRLINSKEYRQYVADCVQLYFAEKIAPLVTNEEQWAIFTYEMFQGDLGKRFNPKRIEHFGNIKGKNDYREANHIIQVGLNRFPDEIYYLYYLAFHPELAAKFDNANQAYENRKVPTNVLFPEHVLSDGTEIDTPKDDYKTIEIFDGDKVILQSQIIEKQMQDYSGHTRAIMNSLLLAEIEQNMFRGIIRVSDSEEEFTFHLFVNTGTYHDLIQLMHDRYDALGATIEYVDLPLRATVQKKMSRYGETKYKKLIRWHDEHLRIGEEYSPQSIRTALKMDGENAVRRYEKMLADNKELRLLLRLEQKREGDRIIKGAYIKSSNWYF